MSQNLDTLLSVMRLNIGTPNNHHFPFGTNEKEKVVVLGVPILRHFRVYSWIVQSIVNLTVLVVKDLSFLIHTKKIRCAYCFGWKNMRSFSTANTSHI